MKILVVEPYHAGSHAAWMSGYKEHSCHTVATLELSGVYWKWRMHGGAVTLARRFLESNLDPDLIVASDMLDLTTFQALTRSRTASIPMAVYFHENQLSYPWSPTDRDVVHKRDKHYGFINYASAMAADAVFFNSRYHFDSFFDELERLLAHFPDYNELGSIQKLRDRASVLRLGVDLRRFDRDATDKPPVVEGEGPLLLWNHRWEYDKNPVTFFKALRALADRGLPFRLAVLGENFSQVPVVFLKARDKLGDRIVQFGYAEDFERYAQWLRRSDILPVTSYQDFFGTSVVEAVYCGCRPLLPRRLAYPELIPERHHRAVFYEHDDELVEKLDSMVRDSVLPVDGDLRSAMLRFDWQTMAPQYDRVFEGVAGRV